MKEDVWSELLHDASLGNINGGIEPWPVGRLSELTIVPTASATTMTFTYAPTEISSSQVKFVITELSTLHHAITALSSRKHGDSWQEWPKGFPNQDDYESMVECAANEIQGAVLWVQSGGPASVGEKKYYLVEMSAQPQSSGSIGERFSALKDYADGLWGVVDSARE